MVQRQLTLELNTSVGLKRGVRPGWSTVEPHLSTGLVHQTWVKCGRFPYLIKKSTRIGPLTVRRLRLHYDFIALVLSEGGKSLIT